MPACDAFAANGDARTASAGGFNLWRKLSGADNVLHVAAGDAISQIIGGEQRGGGNDDRAQLDHGQHGLPQRRNVAEHEQHAVATLNAKTAVVVSEAIGPLRELGKSQLVLAAIFIGHPQRGLVAAIAGGNLVKPVQRPVEAIKLWPLEACVSCGVVVAMGEKEVAGGAEGLRGVGRHGGQIVVDRGAARGKNGLKPALCLSSRKKFPETPPALNVPHKLSFPHKKALDLYLVCGAN